MGIQTALQNLSDALSEALEATKSEGARAFQAGGFEEAHRAANRGRAIGSMIESLNELQAQWNSLDEPHEPHAPVEEEPKEAEIVNREDLIVPILHVLEGLGGKGAAEDVLEKMEQTLKNELMLLEAEGRKTGQAMDWKDSARSVSKLMFRRGLLYANAPKGVWQITPQGRLHLFEQQN